MNCDYSHSATAISNEKIIFVNTIANINPVQSDWVDKFFYPNMNVLSKLNQIDLVSDLLLHKLLQVCKQVATSLPTVIKVSRSCVCTACSTSVVTSLSQALNNL